jgi:phosphatidylglycerophosphate synthase
MTPTRNDGTSATFRRFYRRWNTGNALVVTAGSVAIAVGAGPSGMRLGGIAAVAAPVLAAWSGAAMATLFLAARKLLPDGTGHPAPNILTAARAVTAIALLAGLPAIATAPETLLTVALVLALVETTDFFDGRLARRLGATEFGASWDMESDALFTLSLALLLRAAYGVPLFVVLIGLMRYLYVLLWRYVSDPAAVPRAYKLFARATAATIVVTMIVVLAPLIPSWLRLAALIIVFAMQVVSFGWDLVLQRRG